MRLADGTGAARGLLVLGLLAGLAACGEAAPAEEPPPLVEPYQGTLADVHPVQWSQANVRLDGQSVEVVFRHDPACQRLAGVTAEEKPDVVVITVLDGRDPAPPDGTRCGAGTALSRAAVTLHRPLGTRRLVDGAVDSTGSIESAPEDDHDGHEH